MIPTEWIQSASLRISPYIRHTPLTNDADLNIFYKWENQQITGSFKARGALNKVLSLADWEKSVVLTTASAGNHGQGVALAGQLIDAPVIVFVSNHAVPAKVDAIRALGAEIRYVHGGYELAEQTAIEFSRENQSTWISPYNDGQVIAGQGSIGLELMKVLPPDNSFTVVIPVGGGGLLAGIGAAMEAVRRRIRFVGVNAAASAFMHALYFRGNQDGVVDLPTLADGLSGAIETDALTIPLVRRYADDFITVNEEEIGHAIAFFWKKYNQKIEGSGAVGLAAILSGKVKSPAVIIVTGGNIQPEIHAKLCQDIQGI